MLTDTQQLFLNQYIRTNGDFYGVADRMGLETEHVISWQSNPEFEQAYRTAKTCVIAHLKNENYLCALRKVNDALINGVQQTTVQTKHKYSEQTDEPTEYEVTRSTKNLGVPGWAIKEALQEHSIIKAVTTLASEGVLPAPIAKRILQTANRISEEVRASFDAGADNDHVSEKQAINLIRAAVLGEVEV